VRGGIDQLEEGAMLKRLLKMLSGLMPLLGRRAGVAGACDVCDMCGAPRVASPFGMYHEAGFTCQACCEAHPPPAAAVPRSACYRTCEKCSAFLTEGELSCFVCVACRSSAPPRIRLGPRPMRASAAYGGVVLSARNAAGAERPMVQVLLGATQSEALAGMLLKPGSEGMGLGFDWNEGMLMVGWDNVRRMAELTVCRAGREDEAVGLTERQAARLGTDIAGCLGIPATALCDHSVDAHDGRPDGGICMRCGAIRAGNGEK